ncbi:phosphoribosylanthranilate isomerase [Aerococcus sp. 150760007-1]|uniref:N-(5'-phosphoribosyl)anthranilate isomerase n=1 Tax=Aerococcus urinaeequi TaxID=51665 RepID=A0ABR5ZWG9_9LACT|nr:phosphoribosylanthranilate isomerase [Aerococcus urinaeequi]MBA5746078.1 phosphoribosylanthranilate isomerase [Aerococcus urinaeequi]MBA5828862.1 phosphoribosylanthranilate isomerase [Aerococcus urinaeequi]MBA5859766.1 phosphoribosylanthranilate isomerase [Aerococcus urinaeequi]HCT98501.1 N-(5'-phosphoribosyl)anthranilate isomerase [Aerococcus urinaeequi]
MVKVKICGLRRPEDIEAANAAKPDYVGFIFVPETKRYVKPDLAASFRRDLAADIQTVGIFVNAPIEEIVAICQAGTIDLVQLHGEEDQAYIEHLKGQVNQDIIKSVAVGNELVVDPNQADYLLFDSLSPSRGGSGKIFDWQMVSAYQDKPFFLAGGLGVENIEEALKVVRPYAVDASSSLETDGVKDPVKMQEFVAKIREVTHD